MNSNLQAQKIKEPQLTLFAFHLSPKRGRDDEQTAKSENSMWEKCAILGQEIGISQLKAFAEILLKAASVVGEREPYRELLQPQPWLAFKADKDSDFPSLVGEIYPVRIEDTDALDLTLHPIDIDAVVEVREIRQLNPKNCLLPRHIQPNLGQTLVFFTEPADIPPDYRYLADECVETLLQGSDYPPLESKSNGQIPCLSRVAEGKLFGSFIFEYDVISTPLKPPIDECHILIWFNCYPQKTVIQAQKAEPWLLRLFCYRSKILQAAYEVQLSCDRARQYYDCLEQKTHILDNLSSQSTEKLESLKKLIDELSAIAFELSRQLRDLKELRRNIGLNRMNYTRSLAKIEALSLEDDDLKFLQDFSDRRCQDLHEQIQLAIDDYQPGLDLFEQMMSAIRAQIEIERVQRDRQFEAKITIKALSIGIGVGAISAMIGALITATGGVTGAENSLFYRPFFLITLLLSFGIAVTIGYLLNSARPNKN